MELPIDVFPGSSPPRFRWKQTVETPNGRRTVEHEGMLAPSVEMAIAQLIALAKQLQLENSVLRDRVEELANEVHTLSDRPVRQGPVADAPAPAASTSTKKARG